MLAQTEPAGCSSFDDSSSLSIKYAGAIIYDDSLEQIAAGIKLTRLVPSCQASRLS